MARQVYFAEVHLGDDRFKIRWSLRLIKIGSTDQDLRKRILQLERTYYRPMCLWASFPGTEADEFKMHGRFDHIRVRNSPRRGHRMELFYPVPELMEFIETIGTTTPGTRHREAWEIERNRDILADAGISLAHLSIEADRVMVSLPEEPCEDPDDYDAPFRLGKDLANSIKNALGWPKVDWTGIGSWRIERPYWR